MPSGAVVDRWLAAHRRGFLILLDGLAWAASIALFTLLRYLDAEGGIPLGQLATAIALAIALQVTIGSLLWIYRARNPVGSKADAIAVAKTVVLTTVFFELISLVFPGGRLMAASVPIAAGAVTLSLAMGMRLLWRVIHESTVRPHGAQPALVLGAGSAGTQLVANMLSDPDSPYIPVGLLDDDPGNRHLRVQGVRVMGNRTALREATEESGAEVLIIAIPSARSELFRDVSDAARGLGLQVKVLPDLHQILNGEVGLRDLRDINITDLLGRDAVDTDVAASAGYITGKRVLVTGAGGSIGSELCRQLVGFEPAKLLMLDRDESALHSLQLSIAGHGLLDTDDMLLADIRDAEALRRGLCRSPARGGVPRGSAQAPADARTLSAGGVEDQRPRYGQRAGGSARLWRRGLRQHLHRQGREPEQRPRLLEEDRRATDRRQSPMRPRASSSPCASATCLGRAVRCCRPSPTRLRTVARSL